MATVISFGNEKGGVGKSTTTAILSYLLSKQAKVLAIDFDAQGSLTRYLTQIPTDDNFFKGRTVYEAMVNGEVLNSLYPVSDTLHLMAADDQLTKFESLDYTLLNSIIKPLRAHYDYILIDMPPQPLSTQSLAALYASNVHVCVTLAEPLSFERINGYLELISEAKKHTPWLKHVEILIGQFDPRTSINFAYTVAIKQLYPELVFDTVIKRKTRIMDFSHSGITDRTKKDREALEQYKELVKELISRGERDSN